MEKISIIIPVYKVEPYLRECLDSVVNQTYRNLEIILIDDGSPDNCGAICDAYKQRDSRVVVVHKENAGLCSARNDGIGMATGDWIAFVDSDDWCEQDYYQHLIDAIDSRKPDLFYAGGYFREEPAATEIVYNCSESFWIEDKSQITERLKYIFPFSQFDNQRSKSSYGLPWDKLYRTDFLRKNKLLFDPTTHAYEDYQFNLLVLSHATVIGGCDFIGYHYRQVETSIGKGFSPNKPAVNYDYITKMYQLIDKYQPDNCLLHRAMELHTLDVILNACRCYYFHPTYSKSYRELSEEISKMKNMPLFHSAIWSNKNEELGFKKRILKR